MVKHLHAELMAQYAQDALENSAPWQRWQYKEKSTKWMDCYGGIHWYADVEYRRKPELKSKVEYLHKYVNVLKCGSAETVTSILDATTSISIRETVMGLNGVCTA